MAKIGEGHAQAWLRAGFDEIAQALQAFPADIHPVDEPGLLGTTTPSETANQMGVNSKDWDTRVSEAIQGILINEEAQVAVAASREADPPEMEM